MRRKRSAIQAPFSFCASLRSLKRHGQTRFHALQAARVERSERFRHQSVVWSPLAEGVLTGKYRPGSPPPPDTRATSERMGETVGRRMDDATLERVQRLRPIADRLGLTIAQLALAWILREANVAAAIVGASRPEQVRENAAAADIDLDDETIADVEAIFS
jgi:aryl-alcohol dehydrogenase-like predicted oxidoreductase